LTRSDCYTSHLSTQSYQWLILKRDLVEFSESHGVTMYPTLH